MRLSIAMGADHRGMLLIVACYLYNCVLSEAVIGLTPESAGT